MDNDEDESLGEHAPYTYFDFMCIYILAVFFVQIYPFEHQNQFQNEVGSAPPFAVTSNNFRR